jgi:hypothetical protein
MNVFIKHEGFIVMFLTQTFSQKILTAGNTVNILEKYRIPPTEKESLGTGSC